MPDAGLPLGPLVGTSLPRPRPPLSRMQGRFVSLARTQAQDADALFSAYASDQNQNNWAYLPYGPFADKRGFEDWLTATCLGDDPLFHTIFDSDGRAVGLASYLRIDPKNGVIEVGHIHFSPHLQGSSGSTEVMALMMTRVFDELGYRRYEWKCNALNAASCRAARRLGFTYEGTFRQAAVVKGRNRDTAWFSLLDSEWPAQRARFVRWLSPENFDSTGTQRQALQNS